MIFTLKSSKIDVNYVNIKIIIAVNPDIIIYFIIIMRIFFRNDFQYLDSPSFNFDK